MPDKSEEEKLEADQLSEVEGGDEVDPRELRTETSADQEQEIDPEAPDPR